MASNSRWLLPSCQVLCGAPLRFSCDWLQDVSDVRGTTNSQRHRFLRFRGVSWNIPCGVKFLKTRRLQCACLARPAHMKRIQLQTDNRTFKRNFFRRFCPVSISTYWGIVFIRGTLFPEIKTLSIDVLELRRKIHFQSFSYKQPNFGSLHT